MNMNKNKILLQLFTVIVFIAIISLAFIERETLLIRTVSVSDNVNKGEFNPFLQNDSNAFYEYSMMLPYPCFTISRPPLFLIYTKTVIKLFGDVKAKTLAFLKSNPSKINLDKYSNELSKILLNHTILRESSIFLNLIAIILFFIFIITFAGKVPALICSLLWALNYNSIFYSVLYVRVDMMTIFNFCGLCFLLLLIRAQKHKNLLSIGIVLFFALACLTRLSAISTTFLSLAAFNLVKLLFKQWSLKVLYRSLIILAGIVILISPYLFYNYYRTGCFAPVMNHHAKFWRNQEFAGKPGYPTVKEVASNSYCGADTTTFEYILKDHSLLGVVGQYTKGYWNSIFVYLPKMFEFQVFNNTIMKLWWILLFAVWGIIFCIKKKEYGVMLVLFSLIIIFPFSFILSLNEVFSADPAKNIIGVEPRFNMAILPYAFLMCLIGISYVLEVIYVMIKKLRSNTH